MDAALRALNGFGLGARIGERARVSDPRGWLRAQLHNGPATLSAPPGASPDEISAALQAFREPGQLTEQERQQARQQARRALVEIAASESMAALTQRVTSERPFVERLVSFWSNHLCVSVGAKVLVAPLAGSYKREAIRPHVLGRFEDMVLASAQHPAMLVYLDNFHQNGPILAAPGSDVAGDSSGDSTRTTRASYWSCTRWAWTAAIRNRMCRSWRRS